MIHNTYGQRLNEQMKRIQEAGCVSIFSGILKDGNGKKEEYARIERVETKRFKTDEVIRVGVPVETWMDGDLSFFAMDLGKEVSVSHWCTYFDTFLALWKKEGSIERQPWTFEILNKHLKRLELGDLNKINTDKRKGVISESLCILITMLC